MQYVEERCTCFDGFYVPVDKTPKYLNVLQERGIKKMGNENGSSNIKFKITGNANKEHIKLASSPWNKFLRLYFQVIAHFTILSHQMLHTKRLLYFLKSVLPHWGVRINHWWMWKYIITDVSLSCHNESGCLNWPVVGIVDINWRVNCLSFNLILSSLLKELLCKLQSSITCLTFSGCHILVTSYSYTHFCIKSILIAEGYIFAVYL